MLQSFHFIKNYFMHENCYYIKYFIVHDICTGSIGNYTVNPKIDISLIRVMFILFIYDIGKSLVTYV